MTSVLRGFYGKLPLSPEFLRLHAAGPELLWLDDWLQRGVLYAKSKEGPQWSTLVTQSDVWNFLYAPASGGRIVCGALCMSQDKAGRSFPFLTFLLLEGESLFRHLSVVPLMTAAGLNEFKSLLEGLRASLDWPEFCRRLDAVGNLDLNVSAALDNFDRYLRTATVKGFWISPIGNGSEHRRGNFGYGFLDAVNSAKRSGNGSFSWGLKFPLEVAEMREPYDVSFWIAAMTQVIGRQSQTSGLVIFWNRNPKEVAPCAFASWGPGSPNILRFLVSPSAQDESWHDIAAEKQNETPLVVSVGPFDNPEASLQQVLDFMAKSA